MYLTKLNTMGRKRKLGPGLPERKKQNRIRGYQTNKFKRLKEIFGARIARKLRDAGINFKIDLQNACEKDPEKLLKIWEFGPKTVKRLCEEVSVHKSINELKRIYNKIEPKK